MSKFSLSSTQMSNQFVEDARVWAQSLVRGESLGPGDTDNAMRRIGVRYAIPYSVLWRLRYRKPKDLMVSAYMRLQAAYFEECERQHRRFEHERKVIQAKGWVAENFVRAGDVLARASDKQVGEQRGEKAI